MKNIFDAAFKIGEVDASAVKRKRKMCLLSLTKSPGLLGQHFYSPRIFVLMNSCEFLGIPVSQPRHSFTHLLIYSLQADNTGICQFPFHV